MKTDLSLEEILAIVNIVDQQTDGHSPEDHPRRVLIDLLYRLDEVIHRHQAEIDSINQSARKGRSAKKGLTRRPR
jgi:hypothetical protein